MRWSKSPAIAIALSVAVSPLAAAAATDTAAASRPTFYRDVLPVLQQHCQDCHRPFGANLGGMIAPMSLRTFDEVRPWAKAIAKAVAAKDMPPWDAAPEFHGVFVNERGLSAEEIDLLVRWSQADAPAGRPGDAPPERPSGVTADGWSLGEPDLVATLDPYFVADEVEDLNIDFDTYLSETELTEDRWIRGVEFKPGSDVVHHLCVGIATPDDRRDQRGRRYQSDLGCIGSGSDVRMLPEGYAYFLPRGARIRWGMHYHKEKGPGTGKVDASQVAFLFTDQPATHLVRTTYVDSRNDWEIPPGHSNWRVGASRYFSREVSLLDYRPHMHFRGKAAEYTAVYPDGSRELLLRVPEFEYQWQIVYQYGQPKVIPAGTRIDVSMWFDNSEERTAEFGLPLDQPVRYGQETTAEMTHGWLTFATEVPESWGRAFPQTDGEISSGH